MDTIFVVQTQLFLRFGPILRFFNIFVLKLHSSNESNFLFQINDWSTTSRSLTGCFSESKFLSKISGKFAMAPVATFSSEVEMNEKLYLNFNSFISYTLHGLSDCYYHNSSCIQLDSI